MSDRDALLAMLERMGMARVEEPDFPSYKEFALYEGGSTLYVGTGDEGYSMFGIFKFGADGNVTSHGFAE